MRIHALALATSTLGLLAPALAAGDSRPAPPPAPAPTSPASSTRQLRVAGEGRILVAPDVAVLFAGVESTGKELPAVTRAAAAQMRNVLQALADAGIPQADVQTTRHDVQVERPWDKGRPGPISGYTVSDEVRVTVRDLAKLPSAIDRVTAAGSNTLRGLSFEKGDPAPDRLRALAKAYQAARAKAEALARAAGVTLGEVLSIAEATPGAPVPVFRRAALTAQADGTPVSPGELEIATTVDVAFAIR